MRALVTGHLGFIGSAFHSHLKKEGWTVLGFDIRGSHGLDAVEFFRHDHTHFDLVIHAAAAIPNIADRGKDAMPVASNIGMDSLYFQWLLKTRPTKAVYFSSSAVYPTHLHQWARALHEDDVCLTDIQQPNELYGVSKLVGEIQAQEAIRQGADILVVRPQTVYGPRQSLDYPMPSFIARAIRRDDPFIVWGSGKQGRDFIHVDDAVGATMRMLEADACGPINIGSGIATTMTDVAALICRIRGYTPSFSYQTDKPDGAPVLYADVRRMHEYHDHRISLEEGIERALEAS